jgi:hypothetical protein
MCLTLMDNRARTTTELAQVAGVSKATASEHLHLLVEGGLISIVRQGRNTYHRLASPEVAEFIEGLARISPPLPIRSLRESHSAVALAAARTCYDHLAGRLGVLLYDGMSSSGALHVRAGGITVEGGHPLFHQLGIDVEQLQAERRVLVRECLDWTERRPHLAGLLGARLLLAMHGVGWVARDRRPRGIILTTEGQGQLTRLGLAGSTELAKIRTRS